MKYLNRSQHGQPLPPSSDTPVYAEMSALGGSVSALNVSEDHSVGHRPAPTFSPEHPWLAPLAGWSDLPFRLLCREGGASVCCTEMVSAKGLMFESPGTTELLRTLPESGLLTDAPLVVQLFGAEPEYMYAAVKKLVERGFLWFDCNMGCSVPKVTRTGAGAALLKDPERAVDIARAMVEAAGRGHVGVKYRLGWDNDAVWQPLAAAFERQGVGWLTLHPRTAKEYFGGKARWGVLAELKKSVSVPIIASGDLFTAADGVQCIAETGVDTVMYARGALRNPYIFSDHRTLIRRKEPVAADVFELRARILRHAELARAYSKDHTALLRMRTIVPRYANGLPGIKNLRMSLIACRSWDDFYGVIDHFTEKIESERLLLPPIQGKSVNTPLQP